MTKQPYPDSPGPQARAHTYLGIFEGPIDPAVAVVQDGRVVAYVEEERLSRVKHGPPAYPTRALRWACEQSKVDVSEVVALAVPWDLTGYRNGRIAAHYSEMRRAHDVDARTVGWQERELYNKSAAGFDAYHLTHWRRLFAGDVDETFPPIFGVPHHEAHATLAAAHSPWDQCVVVTPDGSGDEFCTVVWWYEDGRLERLRSWRMPHSLGWFYAAFTEYLGFDAYDGEYKVMGLAAYGRHDAGLRRAVAHVLDADDDGVGYVLDPTFVHYGPHSYSGRFTDFLVDLFDIPPRTLDGRLSRFHEALAFEVQKALEKALARMVVWAVRETGCGLVSLAGGVAHNVIANGALLELPAVEAVFAHPVAGDPGTAMGAALAAYARLELGAVPGDDRLPSVGIGPAFSELEMEVTLQRCGYSYTRPADLAATVVDLLIGGRIIGWFQGGAEAGPRAAGFRSILADPRSAAMKDRINEAVKYREPWRPFAPVIAAEAVERYVEGDASSSYYMSVGHRATPALLREAPAVVHVDGTTRVQVVSAERDPLLHAVLDRFGARTGTPVLLNTSLNRKGEPMACSVEDALAIFGGSGLDALIAGPFCVSKRG